MAQKGKYKDATPKPITGMERLTLRVSSMINHPLTQDRKTVTIHRLETDGDREWQEVMEVLSEVNGIDMIFNDEGESVTLSWEAPSDDDPRARVHEEFDSVEELAPF